MNIAPATYRVEIKSCAVGWAKSGTAQLEITIAGLHRKDTGEVANFLRTVFMSITDNTMGSNQEPGWVALTLKDLGICDFGNMECAVGLERDAAVELEEYEGKVRERWTLFRDLPNGPKEPLTVQELNSLNNKFRSVLLQQPQRQQQPQPQRQPQRQQQPQRQPQPQNGFSCQHSTPPEGSEEIPF